MMKDNYELLMRCQGWFVLLSDTRKKQVFDEMTVIFPYLPDHVANAKQCIYGLDFVSSWVFSLMVDVMADTVLKNPKTDEFKRLAGIPEIVQAAEVKKVPDDVLSARGNGTMNHFQMNYPFSYQAQAVG